MAIEKVKVQKSRLIFLLGIRRKFAFIEVDFKPYLFLFWFIKKD